MTIEEQLKTIKAAVRAARRRWPLDDEYRHIALHAAAQAIADYPDKESKYVLAIARHACFEYYHNEKKDAKARRKASKREASPEPIPLDPISIDSVDNEYLRGVLRIVAEHRVTHEKTERLTGLSNYQLNKTLDAVYEQEPWFSIREAIGLSQQQMAKAANVLYPHLARFEAGHQVPVKVRSYLRSLYRKLSAKIT